ncbi:MAG: hypothetical protein ACREC8_08110 [Limisphaerales bacterium]
MKAAFIQQRIVGPGAETFLNGYVVAQFGVANHVETVFPNVMRERKIAAEDAIPSHLKPVGETKIVPQSAQKFSKTKHGGFKRIHIFCNLVRSII